MGKAPKIKTPSTPKSLKDVKSPKVKSPKTPKGKTPKGKTPKSAPIKSAAVNTPMKSPKSEKKKSLQKTLDQMAASITESPKNVPGKKIKKDNKADKIGKPSKIVKEEPKKVPETDSENNVELDSLPPAGTFAEDLTSIKENAKKALAAFLELSAKKKSNSLFQDLPVKYSLNVTSYKWPKHKQFINILLPHSMYPAEGDVVMVIKGSKKKEDDDEDDELKASLFKQKLLVEHNIKLREVYTLGEFRKEFHSFESKRALCKRVDVFLADKPIIKYIPGVLGKEMYRRKTPLLAIRSTAPDKAEEIRTALHRTVFPVSDRGNSSSLHFGCDELTVDQLLANLIKICHNLRKSFPGGWPNIEKLTLDAFDIPFPIHSASGQVKITKPINKTKKLREIVEGEISTQLNKKVTVYPDGNIKIEKMEKDGDESDIEIPEDDEIADGDDVAADNDEEMDSD